MKSFEVTQREFEELIQNNLNITNPVLLKSGVLGILTNYFTNIKFDIQQYYSKIFREMNPGLAQDFNSLLFHSTIYKSDIQLATPAQFNVSFIVPEIQFDNLKYQIFSIEKNTSFKDTSGIDYMIPERIQITMSSSRVQAFAFTSIDKRELSITRAPDPLNEGSYIYLINYTGVLQQTKEVRKIIVPGYSIGETYSFSQSISSYTGLVSTNAWINTTEIPASLDSIESLSTHEIENVKAYPQFGMKYYKFGSSAYDLDLFLQIYKNSITFETGDGRTGMYLQPNSEIILEVITTLGDSGNLSNMQFLLQDIQTESISTTGDSRLYKSTLNGVSVIGGTNGNNIQSVEEIRRNIFNKMSFRNSLTSINDFELFFQKNDSLPFVDAKFLDARSFLFIFDVLKDENKTIIDTISMNQTEYYISQNPFYPEVEYAGKTFVSPFYYKFLSNNETEAYIVNPSIPVKLAQDNTQMSDVAFDNQIGLDIKYDFVRQKSFITISYGAQADRIYKVTTEDFDFQLDYANNFTWEVNTMFTDTFCIIKNEVKNLKVGIYDTNQNEIIKFYSSFEKYYQLISKQIIYKYFEPTEGVDQLVVDTSDVTLDYLDNELRDLLVQVDAILDPFTRNETVHLLRLPYIDKEYFSTANWQNLFSLLDNFFTVNAAKDQVAYNTRISQSFFNTVDIQPQYQDFLFKVNNNFNQNSPKMDVILDVFIDKEAFLLENKFESIQDLELSIKLDIVTFFKQKIGFKIEYFESELENFIYEKYKNTVVSEYYIKNIEIISPSMFIVNDADTIFYNIKNSKDSDLNTILDFCPPFFHFNVDNIQLTIKY